MASSASISWVSPQAELKAKFERLQQSASHIGVLNSPFFPENISEYIEHKTGFLADTVVEVTRRSVKLLEGKAVKIDINIHHTTTSLTEAGSAALARLQRTAAEDRMAKKSFHVLGATDTTTIWRPEYTIVPEKRDDNSIWGPVTRASWPDRNEFKAEGESRLAMFGERRFPLPRRDKLSDKAIKVETSRGVLIKELAELKGDDIPFFRREVIEMTCLDKLESVEKAKDDPRKTYTIHGVFTPSLSRVKNGQRNPNAKFFGGHGGQPSDQRGGTRQIGGAVGGIGGHGMTRDGDTGAGFNAMGAGPTYNNMTGSHYGQKSGPVAAQGIGRQGGVLGGHGKEDLVAPNLGFAKSANRAITGGRGGRRKRPDTGSYGRGGFMAATSGRSARQESTVEEAAVEKSDNEDNTDMANVPSPDKEFESEEEYMSMKNLGCLLDDM